MLLNINLRSHSDQIRQKSCLHLLHDLAATNLQGDFAYSRCAAASLFSSPRATTGRTSRSRRVKVANLPSS